MFFLEMLYYLKLRVKKMFPTYELKTQIDFFTDLKY